MQNGLGIEKDLEMAFQLFLRAAQQDHVVAQYHLANCYEKGLGIPIDLRQATVWFEKAAMGKENIFCFVLFICLFY